MNAAALISTSKLIAPSFLAHIIQIRKVKLRMIEASEIVFLSILTHQRRAESAARAENYNFHLFSALMSDRRLIPTGAFEQRLPPGWIIHVPLDGLVEALFKAVERLPIQFALRKCRVDRVAAVMAKPVRHE